MRKGLKETVRDKFDQLALSDAQLDALMLKADTSGTGNEKEPGHLSVRAIVGMVTPVLLVALVLTLFFTFTPDNRVQVIADEVVKNHLHMKPLEVRTATFKGVRAYFTQLHFRPLQSNLVTARYGSLTGGRYCSIQGVTAAQLRLSTGKGAVNTLYQAKYRPAVHGKLPDTSRGGKPVTVYARGIAVRIWVEKGVIFAITDIDDSDTTKTR